MKLIVAIVQPHRLDAVKEALARREIFRMTVVEAQGFGAQQGKAEFFRGQALTANLVPKVEIQIAVNDDFVEPAIEAIVEGGRTGAAGKVGDGKILVLPVDDCIRIRTGERGPEAI